MNDLDEFVRQFAEQVMAQKEAMKRCDSTKGNAAAKRYICAWERLRAAGNPGREALTRLFRDERPDVRAMAAAFLLRYATDEATQVLKEVAKGEGIAAFGAQQALQRWAEGDWHLDPADS